MKSKFNWLGHDIEVTTTMEPPMIRSLWSHEMTADCSIPHTIACYIEQMVIHQTTVLVVDGQVIRREM